MKNITESKTTRIAEQGTRIVGFTYSGKKRNVLLGSQAATDYPRYGEKVNPIFTRHKGKGYISGIDNLDGRQVKTFAIAKIRNLSV